MIATHTAIITWSLEQRPVITVVLTGLLSVLGTVALWWLRWRRGK